MTEPAAVRRGVHRNTNVEAALRPLRPYFDDPDVTEIRINRFGEVVCETNSAGRRIESRPDITRQYLGTLTNALQHWNRVGNRPVNDLLLPDGSRGIICWPPVVLEGTVLLAFRKHLPVTKTVAELAAEGRFESTTRRSHRDTLALKPFEETLLDELAHNRMVAFFAGAVRHKLNIAIAGSTGSGKSTFTRSLIQEIPTDERLLVLEDVHEAGSDTHDEVGYMMYGEQEGRISASECLKACMRLSPDRIILTELRDDAAWEYLNSANTGHPGGIFSVHAEDAASTPARIATLVKQSPVGRLLDYDMIMKTIHTTLDVIVFMEKRQIVEVLYDPRFKKDELSR